MNFHFIVWIQLFRKLKISWANKCVHACAQTKLFYKAPVVRLLSVCLQTNPDPNCCLGVFGLSLYTTERDLREVFSKYGPLSSVSIVYDQQSRRSRGFAFVYFENREDSREVSVSRERGAGLCMKCSECENSTKILCYCCIIFFVLLIILIHYKVIYFTCVNVV